MTKRPDISERRIAEVLSWSEADQQKFFEEAFNSLSSKDKNRYMAELDEDLNVYSEKNQRNAAKAMKRKAQKKMRKYARTRPRRRSS